MNKVNVYDFKEKQYSDMLDDIYFYLYNNYKKVALEEDFVPITLSNFINELWANIEQYKVSKKR